jgi:GNAT superfamily N-acetyltransferase
VDTGLFEEERRHVFWRACDGMRDVASEINVPWVPIKLSGTEAQMRDCIGDRWNFVSSSRMMILRQIAVAALHVPDGYSITIDRVNAVTVVQIFASGGELAASGRAAETAGAYCYDQIMTVEAHRRRGLGRVIMSELARARQSDQSQHILTATPDGQKLYESLGWETYSYWITATRPSLT